MNDLLSSPLNLGYLLGAICLSSVPFKYLFPRAISFCTLIKYISNNKKYFPPQSKY